MNNEMGNFTNLISQFRKGLISKETKIYYFSEHKTFPEGGSSNDIAYWNSISSFVSSDW